jgi:AraC family ethanolamine operon transcriptional activator
MWQFDDFDAWGDAVSGANLRLTCDFVERRQWTLGIVDLDGVVVQLAAEGGGNICYGGSVHGGPQLFVPLTRVGEHVANGVPLDEESLLAVPPGTDFWIRVRRRAHSWCSVALPTDVPAPASSGRIVCGRDAVGRLRRIVGDIAASLLDRPGGTPAHEAARREILAAASACLQAPAAPATAVGRPRIDRREIVRRAMAAIDSAATVPTAADLARDVGVTDRTLLRTFQEVFGLPPKRYLLLRELHAVRRGLRDAAAAQATVADVLVRHGIWEFGRFAARYRGQFGELPSETLRRAKA